ARSATPAPASTGRTAPGREARSPPPGRRPAPDPLPCSWRFLSVGRFGTSIFFEPERLNTSWTQPRRVGVQVVRDGSLGTRWGHVSVLRSKGAPRSGPVAAARPL